MGAFYFYDKNKTHFDVNCINIYKRKHFELWEEFDLLDYKLILFRKQFVKVKNSYRSNNKSIFVCGSLFYKGLNYSNSLKELLNDFYYGGIKSELLFGNYAIFFFDSKSKEINFLIDPSFIKNVYFDSKKKSISTDYMVLKEARGENFSYNLMAIKENLVTGFLISPDTYVNEIQKIDRINIKQLNRFFTDITFATLKPKLEHDINNFKDAIQDANDRLENYFLYSKSLSNEFGAHIGLTGGFDSRLLLLHARNSIKKLNVNSFWRTNSIEFKNAKQLANATGLDFISFENDTFNVPAANVLFDELRYGMDGQVRSQNRWDEEYALRDYIEKITDKHNVGFHGCGGEQYRNNDRFSGKISIDSFVKYEWMMKQSISPFKGKQAEKSMQLHIKNKLNRLLNLPEQLDYFDVKRIYNEVWNAANRATRLNVLNQYQFYFAPFTEYQIAQMAYLYIPYLGHSHKFQIEMIKKDEQLASVMTNYGFSIQNGETIKSKIKSYIASLLSRRIIWYIISKKWNNKRLPISKINSHILKEMESDIDFDTLIQNVNLNVGVKSFDILL